MPYRPDSKILILTICSLNKSSGGDSKYDTEESIVARLPVGAGTLLLRNRERVRRLISHNRRLKWQGISLAELEFNKALLSGPDFGGTDKQARYFPALRRYEGRFYQTLGLEGKQKLYKSHHHILVLSGLYGLLKPMESIQLYSCPVEVKSKVFEVWTVEKILTKTLITYIKQHGITRIYDLTAVEAYRKLIDWRAIRAKLRDGVLHCFDNMAAGDYALVRFGQLAKDFLLEASEEELLGIQPETWKESIVFRAITKPPARLPHEDEIKIIRQAERELPQLESHPIEFASEIFGGSQAKVNHIRTFAYAGEQVRTCGCISSTRK